MTLQAAPSTEVKDRLYGFWISQGLSVVAALGIADQLAGGAKSSDELAELTDCHGPSLYRLLRALSSVGIFKEDERARFSLTPPSQLLRTDGQDSIDAEVRHVLHPSTWASWGDLLHCVQTGEAAFPRVFGEDVWTYRARNVQAGAVFDRMASAKCRQDFNLLIAAMDFSNVATIADIGGGNGAVLAEILGQQARLRGILFDQPHVVADAGQVLEGAGVLDRCTIVPGNFFEEVPVRCDMYLLKAILHNWNDDAAQAILRNCRQAMLPNGRIAVIELVLEPSPSRFESFIDLHMLVIHGGRQRTAAEFKALLAAAGFELTGLRKTADGMSVLEGKPAG